MNGAEFANMSVTELVDKFAAFALAQYQADLDENIARYNSLFREMEKIEAELKGRSGDQRSALSSLFEDQNVQVRLKSAIAALAVLPLSARAALEQIVARDEYPQAAEARGMIRAIDNGTFLPR